MWRLKCRVRQRIVKHDKWRLGHNVRQAGWPRNGKRKREAVGHNAGSEVGDVSGGVTARVLLDRQGAFGSHTQFQAS